MSDMSNDPITTSSLARTMTTAESTMSTTNDPKSSAPTLSRTTTTTTTPMSTMNDPAMQRLMSKMSGGLSKKRPAGDDGGTPNKKKSGNRRVEVYGHLLSSWDDGKRVKYTVVVSSHKMDTMEKDERTNGYFDEKVGALKLKPYNGEDFDGEVFPNEVLQVSMWHPKDGTKDDDSQKKFKYGDRVVLKRLEVKKSEDRFFYNVRWVEATKDEFEMTIPKSMSSFETDGYYKYISFPKDNAEMVKLAYTEKGKIYARIQWLDESGAEVSAMLWQEKLFELGIFSAETLYEVLPKALTTTSIGLFGNKEKDENGYGGDGIRFSVRALALGKGTLADYLAEHGETTTKKAALKTLGTGLSDELDDEDRATTHSVHPLNSMPGSKVLNLSEWDGPAPDLKPSTKFFKLFGCVTYAVL